MAEPVEHFDFDRVYYRVIDRTTGTGKPSYYTYNYGEPEIIAGGHGLVSEPDPYFEFTDLDRISRWLFLGDRVRRLRVPRGAVVVHNRPMSQGGCYTWSSDRVELLDIIDFATLMQDMDDAEDVVSRLRFAGYEFPPGFRFPARISHLELDGCLACAPLEFPPQLSYLKIDGSAIQLGRLPDKVDIFHADASVFDGPGQLPHVTRDISVTGCTLRAIAAPATADDDIEPTPDYDPWEVGAATDFDFDRIYYHVIDTHGGNLYNIGESELLSCPGLATHRLPYFHFDAIYGIGRWLFAGERVWRLRVPDDAIVRWSRGKMDVGAYRADRIELLEVIDFSTLMRDIIESGEATPYLHFKQYEFPAGFQFPDHIAELSLDACRSRAPLDFPAQVRALNIHACELRVGRLPTRVDWLDARASVFEGLDRLPGLARRQVVSDCRFRPAAR